MSSTATMATDEARARVTPAGTFTMVLNAAVQSAATNLEQTIGSWTGKLNDVARGGGSSEALVSLADEGIDELAKGGGTKEKAGAEGLKAKLAGKNPFRAAVAAAWQAGTPIVRAAIVSALVAVIVLLVASPLLLIVFLLSLLIAAAVRRVRSASN